MRNFSLLSVIAVFVLLSLNCQQREMNISTGDATSTADVGVAEYEIIKDVRITASDTKTWGGFGWVREAEDSIFTIRDDVPETCYKGPEDKDVTIMLDIFTIYRKTIPILKFNTYHNQKDKVNYRVSLSDNCQSDTYYTTETTFETPLNLEGRLAGCITVSFKSISGLEICSMSLISNTDIKSGPVDFQKNITDKNFGIIEGFYGVRWSNTERERLFPLLNRYGMGLYVYAPKNEPKHRERWREDYSSDEMKRFSELSKKARDWDVEFFYAISPFIDFNYESENDYKILLNKLKSFIPYGINNFAIFADDIEIEKEIKVDSALGKIHTEITNRILKDLRAETTDVRMLFVGTVYSDERINSFEDGYGYLREMAKLDSDIGIFWTGLKTSGAVLTEEDVNQFKLITGRIPIIWDNFWANDGGDGFLANLYLSDYTGRDRDIIQKVSGIAINPLIQGSLTRLNLMKFGRWVIGDTSDDWSENEVKYFGYNEGVFNDKSIREYLFLLSNIYNGNSNQQIKYLELDNEIEDFLNSLKKEDREGIISSINSLNEIFAKMYVIQSVLYNSRINGELFDELFYPTEKVKYDAITGIYAIQFLVSKLKGEPDYSLEKKMKSYLEKSSKQRFVYSAGKINQLTDYISNTNFNNIIDMTAPYIREKVPKECVAGEELVFKPFDNISKIELYGLPASYYSIENQTIKMTIPYSGNYSVAIYGYSNDGSNILFGNLLCK